MVRFISANEARVVSGITTDLISDPDMEELIEDVEYQVEKFLNCNFTPSVQIDIQDGNYKSVIFTQRAPLLTVRSLKTNDTAISLANIDYKRSGLIRLTRDSTLPVFIAKRKDTIIKYVHGRVEWNKLTETDTTSDSIVGTSIVLDVTSESDFAVGDWIEIIGLDANKETTKITAVGTNTITVDELIDTH